MTRCYLCNGLRNVIEDDGPPVCRECVWDEGRIAADPSSQPDTELVIHWRGHSDVVRLVSSSNDGQRFEWAWTERWPAGVR